MIENDMLFVKDPVVGTDIYYRFRQEDVFAQYNHFVRRDKFFLKELSNENKTYNKKKQRKKQEIIQKTERWISLEKELMENFFRIIKKLKYTYKRKRKNRVKRKRKTQRGGWTNSGLWG